jgi:hypothetical protein
LIERWWDGGRGGVREKGGVGGWRGFFVERVWKMVEGTVGGDLVM